MNKLISSVGSVGRKRWRLKGVFMLAILVMAAVASTDSTARVSSHGGDPNLVHACVNNFSGVVRILAPGPANANTLCSTLGASWTDVHLDNDWTGAGTASISLVDPSDQVGIGTNAPAPGAKLHLKGSGGNFALAFTNTSHPQGQQSARLAFDNGRLTFQRVDDSGAFSPTSVNQMAIMQDTGNVGIGTTAPNEQLELTGSLRLPPTTATTGIIKSGPNTLIHTFGDTNFFAGENAGNLTMTGGDNTATGDKALQFNTTGIRNTATGQAALINNTTGISNTATGKSALSDNNSGNNNTAIGQDALRFNTTGNDNTAMGLNALSSNITGNRNTAVGFGANVREGNLTNATAIGAEAIVSDSNKIRLGNAAVTVIEGQVPYTFISDARQKENFLPVDGEETLRKLRQLTVSSWNYKGQDPTQLRHYGPMAQDFFAAFGHDDLGTIGSETTINSGDIDGIMLLAIQALEQRTVELQEELRRAREELAQLQAEKKAGMAGVESP
jgi:hypothetical protein